MEQPYAYRRRELVEPDWTRLPGWKDITAQQWADVQWQRVNCVKNIRQLRTVMGDLLTEEFYTDLERDQTERATMSMLLPPQMLNTIVSEPTWADGRMPAAGADFTAAFYADPVRRYMLPVFSDRRTDWSSHPYATCRPARSTAATAPAWISSATPPRRSPSSSSPASRWTGIPRSSTTCGPRRACATSSSPVATWPTCRGRTSRPGWTTSRTSSPGSSIHHRTPPASTRCRGRPAPPASPTT